MEPDLLIAIFSVGEGCPLMGANHTVAAFVILLACRLVLLNWKNPHPPCYIVWLRDAIQHLKLGKLR